jgi:exosortase
MDAELKLTGPIAVDAPHDLAPFSTKRARHYLFAVFGLLSVIAFWRTLAQLVHVGLTFDFCSQVLVAPLITLVLVYWRRREVFAQVRNSFFIGGSMFIAGLTTYAAAHHYAAALGSYNGLSMAAFAIVLIWLAGFYAIYGSAAFRSALFPLGFLLLMVPIPSAALDGAVLYLQAGSTAIADGIFQLFGVPVMRNGFLLSLPGLTIEVAKECSSIRSSLALVITCLLAGCLFLRSPWKRAALVLIALPLSIFKNGVRIVTLSLLSIYVNPAFMTSDLHRDGGILFYILALAILYPVFRWFEKSDRAPIRSEER